MGFNAVPYPMGVSKVPPDLSRPELVSFDCAGTLLHADWNPAQVAVEAMQHIGGGADPGIAYAAYERLLRQRWPEFLQLNRSGSLEACDEFWVRLGVDWSQELGLSEAQTRAIKTEALDRIYRADSDLFQPLPDAFPCLNQLRDAGFRMIVISNWDLSLHRFLRVHQMVEYFELVVPSLFVGIEKPDRGLFDYALAQVGVEASAAVHVGDHLVDDLQGARGAGMTGVHLDRGRTESVFPFVRTLTDFSEWLCSI